MDINNWKQALNHGLVFRNSASSAYSANIKSNQDA